MMRGPSYDDAYITRKMSQMPGPTFSTPGASPYGRSQGPGYMQDSYTSPYSSYSSSLLPESLDVREERRSTSPSPLTTPHTSSYRPSASTQLILNRVALGRTSLPNPPPPTQYHRGYPPMGPPPRMMPRMHPSYYDYDYPGYGGGYYYMPPPPPPRMSRYDSYLDDEVESPYLPRNYRPRVVDIDDTELKDKRVPHVTTSTSTTTPRISSYTPSTRDYSPGMLQDHVDKMRIRLKSLAYSLDPTGPVPEIILPERTKKSGASASGHDDKKYQSGPKHLACVEFAGGQPQWKRRARARYPSEDTEHVVAFCKAQYVDGEAEDKPEKEKEKLILKDRLSNRIHQFFNSTLNPDQFDKYLKTYRQPGPRPQKSTKSQMRDLLPDSSSRLSKYSSSSKWEEPDTVFGGPSDRKPYSKAITDGTTEETSEEKKERRKKKKSKERELAAETAAITEASSSAAPAADVSTSEVDAVSVVSEGDALDDEKERKKLEKKKRKAEREAAAKAAMEAELAALAAAEAELARLEQESSTVDGAAPVAAPEPAPEEVAAEVKRTAGIGAEEGGGEGAAEAGEGTAAGAGGETAGGEEVEAEPAAPTPAEPEPEPAPEPADEPEAPAPADEPTPAPAEEEADVPEAPVTQRSEEELEE